MTDTKKPTSPFVFLIITYVSVKCNINRVTLTACTVQAGKHAMLIRMSSLQKAVNGRGGKHPRDVHTKKQGSLSQHARGGIVSCTI